VESNPNNGIILKGNMSNMWRNVPNYHNHLPYESITFFLRQRTAKLGTYPTIACRQKWS